MSVEAAPSHHLLDTVDDPAAQACAVGGGLLPLLGAEPQRVGHSDHARYVLGPGPPLALLAAAHLLGLEGSSALDVQGADPLGAIELVGRQAHQVDAQGLHVEVQEPRGLDGVGMHRDGLAAAGCLLLHLPGDLRDGLYGADLIVGQHDADHDRPVGDGPSDLYGVHQAVAVNRQIGDLEPELLQLVAGVQHGVMLYAGRDQVVAHVLEGEGYPLECGVVRFGAPAGEDDLAGARPQDPRNGLPGLVGGLAPLLSQGVYAGRVAEAAGEVGQHRPEHLMAHGRRRRMVHVYQLSVIDHLPGCLLGSGSNPASGLRQRWHPILARLCTTHLPGSGAPPCSRMVA